MKMLLIFFLLLIPIVFISGCSTVKTTGKAIETVSKEEKITVHIELTKPTFSTVQTNIGDKVETGVTRNTEEVETEVMEPENETAGSKTFQITVVEGIGIRESGG